MPNGKASSRQPVGKAFQLLRSLVDNQRQDVGVRELARLVELPVSTVHRLLATLSEQGFVHLDEDTGRCSLGLEFYRLAMRASSGGIASIARPRLSELTRQFDQTSFLLLYSAERAEGMFAVSAESTQSLRYVIELHVWRPITGPASGLAVLAYLGGDEQKRLIAASGASRLQRQALRAKLDVITEQGYAVTQGERVVGAVGVAAPVFERSGKVIGSVGLSIPQSHFTDKLARTVPVVVAECGQLLSKDLGWTRA